MGGPLMAKVELRYLHCFEDRHGHPRCYFRKDGKNVPLKGEPGSADFMEAYAAALANVPAPAPRRAPIAKGSFKELALLYYASPKFLALSAGSRKNYRRVIEKFCEGHGHRLVKQMGAAEVEKIMGRMAEKPGAGIILLKRLRGLLRYAIKLGWISHDPSVTTEAFKSKEIHTWTEEEIAQFEARWPTGTKQRLGFALHLFTGQRGSDVHRMVWSDVAGDLIRVVQAKTGAKLAISLHPKLQRILAVASKDHMAILTTAYGKAFSVKGWGNYMSDAIGKAGLPGHCKAHGLRKAAARRLAEAGCSEKQIAAVTGHKSLEEVARYTRAADQEKLNRQAIAKQVENEALATPTTDVATHKAKAN